jgi:hypothetical protein
MLNNLAFSILDGSQKGKFLIHSFVFLIICSTSCSSIKLASNSSTRSSTLSRLSINNNLSVRRAIAINPSTPITALIRLADDPYWSVKLALVGNPNTPDSIIKILETERDKQLDPVFNKPPFNNPNFYSDTFLKSHQEEISGFKYENSNYKHIDPLMRRPFEIRRMIMHSLTNYRNIFFTYHLYTKDYVGGHEEYYDKVYIVIYDNNTSNKKVIKSIIISDPPSDTIFYSWGKPDFNKSLLSSDYIIECIMKISN